MGDRPRAIHPEAPRVPYPEPHAGSTAIPAPQVAGPSRDAAPGRSSGVSWASSASAWCVGLIALPERGVGDGSSQRGDDDGQGPRAWLTAPLQLGHEPRGADLGGGRDRCGAAAARATPRTGRSTWTRDRCSGDLVRLPVLDFHTMLTEYQLAPPGFLVLERLAVRLPGNDRDGRPVVPAGVRGRFDVPVPLGGPAVPAAPGRADRGGPLRAVRLADLLLVGDQAILVRPGADAGRLLLAAGPVPVPSRRQGGSWPWGPSARSASGSRIRWRWCSRESAPTCSG